MSVAVKGAEVGVRAEAWWRASPPLGAIQTEQFPSLDIGPGRPTVSLSIESPIPECHAASERTVGA